MTSFALLDIGQLMVDSDGNVYGPRGQRALSVDTNKYRSVNTAQGRVRVHRLVAEAFLPKPDDRHDVAHYDGDKSNNKASNLYWATKSENMLDKRRHGSNMGGVRKLDWDKVRYIRSHPVYRGSQQHLADELGVAQTLISMVLLNKIWKENEN